MGFERTYSTFDLRRERHLAHIRLQLAKIFSPDISLSSKKQIVEEMKLKKYGDLEWRKAFNALENLRWLEQAVIKHEAPPSLSEYD